MAILDHIRKLFRVSPRSVEAKLAPIRRSIRARYDAAQTSRDSDNHWAAADGLSAAAANSPEVRRTLRNRARYEVANNSYAAGMVRTLANDVIGVGPQLQMLSGQDQADKEVETSFWNWMQAVRLPDKLRLMRMARCVDGETFALLVTNPEIDHPVTLDLKIYEAEQIAKPFSSLVDDDLTDGITLDGLGYPVSYSVLKEHPGDLGLLGVLGDADTVGAARMLHLFKCERAGQYRGIPEIMSSLPLYAQLRRYTLAVIGAAETAASIAGLLQTQSSAVDPDEVEEFDLFDLERNQLMTLPKGWAASQMKAEQPSTTYEMFKREIIAEIARCMNMPYNVAAGDSSRYNYASGRLDHKTYFKAIRVDRSFIVNAAMERVFAAWWREARLVDAIPLGLNEFDSPPPHEWRWDGDEHVDPLKEASAAKTLMSIGALTFAKYYGRSGDDWEEQQQQGAKELGVSLVEYRALLKDTLFPKKAEPEQAIEEDRDE